MGKRHKYNAVPTEYFYTRYDSKAEAQRAKELDALLSAGVIRRWARQVKVLLCEDVHIAVRIDFVVDDTRDGVYAEEVKGFETERFKLIKRMWPTQGPMPLVILKRKGNSWTREFIGGKATA